MKILVLSLKGLGDTLMALPLLRAIAAARPEARITMLVPDGACEELLRGLPYVTALRVGFRRPGPALIGQVLRLLWRLRAERYDASVTTFPSNRPWYNLLARWAGAPLRVTHDYGHRRLAALAFLQNRRVPSAPPKHEVEHNLDLLAPLGAPPPAAPDLSYEPAGADKSFAESFFASKGLAGAKVLGLHPAVDPAQVYKAWSPAAVKTLAAFADWADAELGLKVLVFCGPDEKEAAEALVSGAARRHLLFEGGTLGRTAALIARCSLFVNTDSGLGHLAAAVGVPTVTLFGPANPAMTRPYGARGHVLAPALPCAPCYDYPYASIRPRVKCGGTDCLRDIDLPGLKSAALKVMREND